MEPIRVDPFTGALNFLGAMATGQMGPIEQIQTKLDSIIVDTALPPDTNIWETGIKRKDIEGEWVIVEQYENKEHAKAGHDKWVKMMTDVPDLPIKDTDNWSLEC